MASRTGDRYGTAVLRRCSPDGRDGPEMRLHLARGESVSGRWPWSCARFLNDREIVALLPAEGVPSDNSKAYAVCVVSIRTGEVRRLARLKGPSGHLPIQRRMMLDVLTDGRVCVIDGDAVRTIQATTRSRATIQYSHADARLRRRVNSGKSCPPLFLMPTCLVPPQSKLPPAPASAYRVESRLAVRSGKDRWLFLCRSLRNFPSGNERCLYRYISVSKNGCYVVPPTVPDGKRFPFGTYFKFSRPDVKSPYPVVAIRGHSGIGWHWDTTFYRIRRGRLQTMGHAPGDNSNGPVNWRGRTDRWLFDSYNRYSSPEEKPYLPDLLLYRIEPRTGRLTFVRRWPSPKGGILKDTVRLNRW